MIILGYKLLGEDKQVVFTGAITIKEDTPYLQIEEYIKDDLFINEDPLYKEENNLDTYQRHYEYYTDDLGYELVISI